MKPTDACIELLLESGSHFQKKLAYLYRVADRDNQEVIAHGWSALWDEFNQIAASLEVA